MTTPTIMATAPLRGPSVVRIPIKRRKGPQLYAIVDETDAPRVLAYKWHVGTDGYAERTIDTRKGTKERMARLVLGLTRGDGLETDHISRDRLDNRRSNLRVVTHAQNSQNRLRTDGVSKFRGVSKRKGKKDRPWCAYGCVAGKQTHLGFFETEQEAADAARAWRREYLPHAVD